MNYVYFLPNVFMSFFFFFFGLIGAAAGAAAVLVGAAAGAASPAGAAGVVSFASEAVSAATLTSSLGASLASLVSTVALVCSSCFLAGSLFGFRFSLGRLPHVAPPPTGVFFGALKAGCSCFCFSMIASAAARSGKSSSSSVSSFVDPPTPPNRSDAESPPARSREGTHFPPVPAADEDNPAAAAPNRDAVFSFASCSFFSFSSLIR
mmetsp:Transcript_8477/g.13419  ORF Transcript_8477/g.13419 Transcript_8477/m.13419 type:complete len:207 (+) Transcript_8477:131-751(+)